MTLSFMAVLHWATTALALRFKVKSVLALTCQWSTKKMTTVSDVSRSWPKTYLGFKQIFI